MAPTSSRQIERWLTTTILTVTALVVGLVVGALQAQVRAEERYVSHETYQRDQDRILHKLDRIESQLGSLIRAVERNSARLEER